MKFRFERAMAAALALVTGQVLGQDGHMMNGSGWTGGWMGGYGGMWIPVLLAVIVGLLVWIVMRKQK
ncbi:hypothetical protein [Methyloversatilis sp. XJ19-49]|uniref:hypothetical protein n=1 Tax=Methyloversatilis sp. XJ19-49 TaxID=2963429 RepID=UPI00211B8B6A|nr:hypothetical protein [Methyloversatilis sp. XJ19-49]MCQ9379884.1 hypothetical protein [Methyloversatilis sp. XJ19-49]